MNTSQLKTKFLRHANSYAKFRGYEFGIGASHDIESFCQRAAEEVLKHPDADGNMAGVLIQRANQAFETFIDAMIVEANEIPNYAQRHPGKIGEDTFARAKDVLCPIWPFC